MENYSYTPLNHFIGHKRSSPNPLDNSLFHAIISNEFKSKYEKTAWIYRNIFGYNWDDPFIKECSTKLYENFYADSFWFLINNLYFPNDLEDVEGICDGSLQEIFTCFTGENESINIKKSSLFKNKIQFYNDLLKLNEYYLNISAENSNLNTLEKKTIDLLKTIKEINKKKISKLTNKISNYFLERKNKLKKYYFPILNSNTKIPNNDLLRDMCSITKQKEVSQNFFEYLKIHTFEVNKQKNSQKKIFNFIEQLNLTKQNDEWQCFICNNGDLEENQIVYECELCKVAVHQSCFGIQTKDVDNWFCDACLKYKNKEKTRNLECILCPVIGGAMKETKLPIDCEFVKKLKILREGKEIKMYNNTCIIPNENFDNIEKCWVHLSCALWNPSIIFGNFEKKTDIKYIDTLSFEKFNEKCYVCLKKGFGPCIKCNYKSCNFQCHPECARINGYNLEIENINNELNYNIYCLKHNPIKLTKILNKVYKVKEISIMDFSNQLEKIYKIIEKKYAKNLLEIKPQVKLGKDLDSHILDEKKTYNNNIFLNINTNSNYSHQKSSTPSTTLSKYNYNDYFNNKFNELTPIQKKFIQAFKSSCYKLSDINLITLKKNKDNINNNVISYSYIPSDENKMTINYNDTLNEDFPWKFLKFENYDDEKLKNFYINLIPSVKKFHELILNNTREVSIFINSKGEKEIKEFEEDSTIYCYCKKQSHGEFMICCKNEENCVGSNNGWFHPQCVEELKDKTKEELNIIEFMCKECKEKIKKENENKPLIN